MGSFNGVCIVSGLPIEAGDPIRFLALTQSRYHTGAEYVCYVGGRWQLRGVPLRGKYNDYGSIEDFEPKVLTTRVFFESFALDVIEKGVGDNQCHDVHVRRKMKPAEWLSALWEGRVEVSDERARAPMPADMAKFRREMQEKYDREVPEGIPTMHRLEKLLKGADLPVTTSYGENGYVLDEQSRGYIRVRWGAYGGGEKHLEKARKLFEEAGYPGVVTAGTGSYSGKAELLVVPSPKIDHFGGDGVGPARYTDRDVPRPVAQAMVREDVWQLLLRVKLTSWSHKGVITVETFKEAAKEYLAKRKALEEERVKKGMPESLRYLLNDRVDHENLFGGGFHKPEGETGWGLLESFELAQKLAIDENELESFVSDLCETMMAQWAYSHLHGQWHPSTNGSQEPNWPSVRNFHRRLGKIRGKWEDEPADE